MLIIIQASLFLCVTKLAVANYLFSISPIRCNDSLSRLTSFTYVERS